MDTVRISKVTGHANEALVRAGRARDLDRLGNNGADEAADFGHRLVPWWNIDARRKLASGCPRSASVFYCHCRLSTMMEWLVLLWILWFGLLVVPLRGVGLCMLFVIGPFCLGLLVSGMGNEA